MAPEDSSEKASNSRVAWWIIGIAGVAFIIWYNTGLQGLAVKSGIYECVDSRGSYYLADVLDRDVRGFGRVEGESIVTLAHKSVQRSSLFSDRDFKMAIEGNGSVNCTWAANN